MLKLKYLRMLPPSRKRLFFVIIFFSLGLFTFEAYEITADQPHNSAENNIDQLSVSECGVVLTGSPGRIREAFEILAQKKIQKLIVSGVYKETQLIEMFPQLPFYPEINSDDVILEKRSESTFGNAVQSLAIVQTLKCKDVLLITSQQHMHRAFKIFKTIYPDNIQIKKYYVFHQKKASAEVDLLIETIKSVFYLVFGRVL